MHRNRPSVELKDHHSHSLRLILQAFLSGRVGYSSMKRSLFREKWGRDRRQTRVNDFHTRHRDGWSCWCGSGSPPCRGIVFKCLPREGIGCLQQEWVEWERWKGLDFQDSLGSLLRIEGGNDTQLRFMGLMSVIWPCHPEEWVLRESQI